MSVTGANRYCAEKEIIGKTPSAWELLSHERMLAFRDFTIHRDFSVMQLLHSKTFLVFILYSPN